MAIPLSIPSQIYVLPFIISCLLCLAGNPRPRANALSLPLKVGLRNDSDAIRKASNDYGNIIHEIPCAVLSPSSTKDIVDLIKSSNSRPTPFTIAARGRGHSTRGQSQARDGVVVDMTSFTENEAEIRVSGNSSSGFYADVWAGQLWIDVLQATLQHGLTPVSWTDYLYATVGGTLSNAGIGGQSFLHGPQISNVLELDVITGKGELITASKHRNSELFFGVLGGLGQFGIITRARIVLEKAPTRVKWVRLLYSNFSIFTSDQEHLISSAAPDYVEGFLIRNEETTNEWRSSFSTPSRRSDIASLLKKHRILYAIELVKYYDNQTANTIDKEFQALVKQLNFIPELIFSADASYTDFLSRLGNVDNLRGPVVTHPWLDLLIPKSGISDFNAGVVTSIIPRFNETSAAAFLFYPTNAKKFDARTSAVIPDEDIIYLVSLLHETPPRGTLILDNFNHKILEFLDKCGIKAKWYMPHYESKKDWEKHYGSKWETIQQRKAKFDPKKILSPGQRIFNSF